MSTTRALGTRAQRRSEHERERCPSITGLHLLTIVHGVLPLLAFTNTLGEQGKTDAYKILRNDGSRSRREWRAMGL
jgi:hypothetical protein